MAAGSRLAQATPRDRWAIGDLALEAVPPGQTKPERAVAQHRLADFADTTGIPLSVIKDCYYTSQAWAFHARVPGVSHAKHSRYRGRPNRIELLLNEEMDDGLPSGRLRDKIHRVEGLLADKDVRVAVMDRSARRSRALSAAARSIENEDVIKARALARIELEQCKADQLAAGIKGSTAERFIKASSMLARTTGELLDLFRVVDQVPEAYRDRIVNGLEQVIQAAEKSLHVLRPELREPQPFTVIDHVDDVSEERASDKG